MKVLSTRSYVVVDTELSHRKGVGGIVSIGAVSLSDPEAPVFYIECQLHKDAQIEPAGPDGKDSLYFAGFTREQVYDPSKPTAGEAIEKFIEWQSQFDDGCVMILGNIDQIMLELDAFRAGVKTPKNWYYTREYHTTAMDYAHQKGIEIPLDENGRVNINIPSMGEMVGVKILREEHHNALQDACYEAEIMNRMLEGTSFYGEDYQDKIKEIVDRMV